MKKLKNIFVFTFFIFSIEAKCQLFVSSVPFSAATPFLEPDERRETLKLNETDFAVLSKVKGNLAGSSEYSLEKYDGTLKNYFKIPFTVGANEDVREMFFNGKDIIIFTVSHNSEASESKLTAYGFNSSTGEKLWDKILMKFKIAPYTQVKSRAAVEETFENAISSGLSRYYIVPFEFQFGIQFSPDRNKFIAYIYDYSNPNLIANAAIFDKDLNKISEGIIPIDNGFINYGIHVNNRGDVYILNGDKLGRIVLIQYNLITKKNELMDIQYASTQRESLKLVIKSDDEVFVGCTNAYDNKLQGVMYSKFNFEKKLVEKINFHDLSDQLMETASIMRASSKLSKGEEDWSNYELTQFIVNEFEKVVMVLEKREISGNEYVYKTETVLEPDRWKERIAKVITEGVLLFSFNSQDELMWENYYPKFQTGDISIGIITSSMLIDVNDEKIRMIYASSDKPAGIYNTYNYVQWDATNGNKIKDMQMENQEGLSLVRNYAVWYDDKAILVGRKGLLGKKYIMSLYSINSGN